MPQTLEQKLLEEKNREQKAKAMDAIQNLRDEGIDVFASENDKPSGFEISTGHITQSMHRPENPAFAELHSNIPQRVLASVYEMHSIYKAALREQHMLKHEHTITKSQEEMNDTYLAIMREMCEHIDRELAAVDGYRANQAVQNIQSLVTGEQMKQAALIGSSQHTGLLGRVKQFFVGGK